MNKSEIIESLNKLLSYAELYEGMCDINRPKDSYPHFSHYFEQLQKHFTFRLPIRYVNLYSAVFWSIYKSGSLQDKFSIDYVEKKLHDFLISLKVKNEEVTNRNYDKFYNKLNMEKVESVFVFCKLYGVDINSDNPIKIGCFTLYNFPSHTEQLLSITEYESEDKLIENHGELKEHATWIATKIETADTEKAYELARYNFEVFQGVCQFFFDINKINAFSVCIFNDIQPIFGRSFILSHTQSCDKFENIVHRHKNIDGNYLAHKMDSRFSPLIERLFSPEKNEVNDRVKYAFTTYGRVMYEHSNAQQLVMYITAIESLVEYKVKDISELVSRYISCMICNDSKEYLPTKENFKFIYGLRSDISHGSKVSILKGDLGCAKSYCVKLILKFISDTEIESLTTRDELKSYLENKAQKLEVIET